MVNLVESVIDSPSTKKQELDDYILKCINSVYFNSKRRVTMVNNGFNVLRIYLDVSNIVSRILRITYNKISGV